MHTIITDPPLGVRSTAVCDATKVQSVACSPSRPGPSRASGMVSFTPLETVAFFHNAI